MQGNQISCNPNGQCIILKMTPIGIREINTILAILITFAARIVSITKMNKTVKSSTRAKTILIAKARVTYILNKKPETKTTKQIESIR